MDNDKLPQKTDEAQSMLAPTIKASLFWLVLLAAGVVVLAAAAILVGAATPFRYVGF